jgi:hypothetical protein
MNKKCIVITTINRPTEQILYYTNIPDWKLIVVGDSKTEDSNYKNINCVYLGLEEQKDLFPSFYDKIPLKSYTRKMFGYLYAIKNQYSVIYDTDDDNVFLGDINNYNIKRPIKSCSQIGFVNLYKIFTREHIWPRGIPPGDKSINIEPELSDLKLNMDYAIIQGLVNNDPDVDAYYRININNSEFSFEKDSGYDVVLNKGAVCPFNTQNTFWIDTSMFYALYLPTTVSFRYTDILRGFVALFQLWKKNKTIKFTLPTAFQKRNEHDLQKDYESEVSMYETANKVIELLSTNQNSTISEMYLILAENKIVDKSEIDILNEWMKLIESFQ